MALGYILTSHDFTMEIIMIIDKSTSTATNPNDLKNRLYQIVEDNKISSISMMSDLSGINEDRIRSVLEELVTEGILDGSFTSDGQRFFLSEVRVSTAPFAPTRDEGYIIEKRNTKTSKLVFITGFAMIIVGYAVRSLFTISEMLESIGVGILLTGMIVLVVGWFMFSRANPPSQIM